MDSEVCFFIGSKSKLAKTRRLRTGGGETYRAPELWDGLFGDASRSFDSQRIIFPTYLTYKLTCRQKFLNFYVALAFLYFESFPLLSSFGS